MNNVNLSSVMRIIANVINKPSQGRLKYITITMCVLSSQNHFHARLKTFTFVTNENPRLSIIHSNFSV
jgi:hypothetical protein